MSPARYNLRNALTLVVGSREAVCISTPTESADLTSLRCEGPHQHMAGTSSAPSRSSKRADMHFIRAGHDINYLALSGVLSVRLFMLLCVRMAVNEIARCCQAKEGNQVSPSTYLLILLEVV